MKTKRPRIRIINKSKEGALLATVPENTLVPWDEFKKNFNLVDKVYATPKDEYWKELSAKIEDFDKVVSKAVMFAVMADTATEPGKKLAALSSLGGLVDDVVKIFGCDEPAALRILQAALSRYAPYYNQLKKKNTTVKKTPQPKPTSFKLGDIPDFEKLTEDGRN